MNVLDIVNNNARHNEQRWINNKDSTEARRFLTLSAEVGELADAIKGKHEHSSDVELIQIAGICLNWLQFYVSQAGDDVDLEKSLRIANHED